MKLSDEMLEDWSKQTRDTEHKAMAKELLALRAAKKIAVEALEFYANERNYTKEGIIFDQYNDGDNYNPVPEQVQDYGIKARDALAAIEKMGE